MTEQEDLYMTFLNACHEGNESVVYQLYDKVRRKDWRHIAKGFENALYYKQINILKLLACLVYDFDLAGGRDMMYLLEDRVNNLYWFCNETKNEEIIRFIFDFVPRASSWFCNQYDFRKFAENCMKTNFKLFRYIYEFDGEFRGMFTYRYRYGGPWPFPYYPVPIVEEKYTDAFQYFLMKEKNNLLLGLNFNESDGVLVFKEDITRYPIRKRKYTNWFKLTVAYMLCKKNLHLYVVDLFEVFEN